MEVEGREQILVDAGCFLELCYSWIMSLASVYNSCQQDTGNIVVVVVTPGKASRDTRNYFVSWSAHSQRDRDSHSWKQTEGFTLKLRARIDEASWPEHINVNHNVVMI